MKREVSLYLDLLRFMAALVVFVQHFAWHHFSGGLFWQIGPYGAQAVIVFFVLSGYVIGYVTDRPGATARGYALDRAARIYSVALPALLLTFVLDAVGQHLRPELFDGGWFNGDQPILSQLLRNGLFLNQIWFTNTHPGSNVPYWSMGYEVWYYVAFGLLAFLPRSFGMLAALAVMVVIGPRVAAMFPVWLSGVVVYRLSARGLPRSRVVGVVLFVGAPLLWAVFEAVTQAYDVRASQPLSDHGWDFWQDALVGFAVAAHLLGLNAVAPAIGKLLLPCAGPIRWLAGRSFTLYLMQVPLLQLMLVLAPWPATSWRERLLIAWGALAIVVLLAEVTERRKAVWRRMFAFILSRLLPSGPAAAASRD
jgi:peptidoglycan/LPS O-acetylase OafA/YrhL